MTKCRIRSGSFQWARALPAGGVFDTYTLIQGVDQFIPVDVYIPGCPPRPEDLIDAVMQVQGKNHQWCFT